MDILSTDGHQSPRETVGSPRVSDMRGSTRAAPGRACTSAGFFAI